MKKITIYTMDNCAYCKVVKEEFEKKNIKFENRTTVEYENEWKEIVNLTGLPITPTIHYDGSYFVPSRDFNSPQQLITILENFKKSKFGESKQIVEKIKTLNYNITTAFGRLDQLLQSIEAKLNPKENEHKSTS